MGARLELVAETAPRHPGCAHAEDGEPPVLLVFLFWQKSLVKGIGTTGIK